MNPAGVFAFTLNPRIVGERDAKAGALLASAVERLQNTPGIEAVGTANPPAFMPSRLLVRLRLETGQPEPAALVETSIVSPGYFAAVGVPIVTGRTFVESEVSAAPGSAHAAIVNIALARVFFGDQPAIGQRLLVGSGMGAWTRRRDVVIVGVAGDTRTAATLRLPTPAMVLYEPTGSAFVFSRIYVRSPLPLGALQGRVYQTLRAVEPRLPLADTGGLTDEVERLIPEDVAFARLLLGVAVAAMLLGFAGVYAVTAYGVTERTREFGVRIALGASRARVIRQAGRGVGAASAAGAVIGLAAYGVASRVIASRLYGISPLDPATLAGAMGFLGVATLVAAWLPARRATRIDPVDALRAE
jgi:hypothetical protein